MGALLNKIGEKLDLLRPGQKWSERDVLVNVFVGVVDTYFLDGVIRKYGATKHLEIIGTVNPSIAKFFNPISILPVNGDGKVNIGGHYLVGVPRDSVEDFKNDVHSRNVIA